MPKEAPAPPDSPRGCIARIYRHQASAADPSNNLDSLAAIRLLRNLLEEEADHHVLTARRLGATWEQIGTNLGISKQAVQQKYGRISAFAGYGSDD